MTLWPLIIIAIAHLPLVTVYFQQLWSRPHYQFFPLVLASSAFFIWQRWPLRHEVSRFWAMVGRVLPLVCAGLLTIAFLRLSPMLAYLSLVLVVGSILIRCGVPALGPWLLLLLVVRIPYGQDVALIQWMQQSTTRLSSTALDKIGIEHIADGNVLLFPTTSLFVEEACSGVVSLLAIVACAAILAVWWHRSIIHTILLGGAALLIAGAMNVVRVVAIAIALDSFDINLTEGWRHEMVGLCIFAVSLLALFSVDRLLFFALSPIPMNPLAGYWDDVEGNVFVRLWNRYVGLEEDLDGEVAYADDYDETPAVASGGKLRGWRASWDWAMAAIFLALGSGQVMAGIGPFSVAPEVSQVAVSLEEDSLPSSFGEWQMVGFEEVERDSSSAFGEHSRIWAFHNGEITVRVSLDFVFPEWHELTACYRGVGWKLESSHKQAVTDGEPFVEASFGKPKGDWALLMFDLFDDEGRPYEAPEGTFVHPKLRRIMSGQNSRWNLPNYYQVQALTASSIGPISAVNRQSSRELFEWFRQQMLQQVAANELGSINRRDAAAVPRPDASSQSGLSPNAFQPADNRAAGTIAPQTPVAR